MDQKELDHQPPRDETVEASPDSGAHNEDGDHSESAPSDHPDHSEARPSRPRYLFLGVVSALVLAADVGSKAWAELALSPELGQRPIVLVSNHLTLALAYNEGGAWGLLQSADSAIRKPFFLVVSLVAIAFIVSLYRRLLPSQWALRWGLPLVLGGALGNLSDRIARSGVVDFILYRGDWVGAMNRGIAFLFESWTVTDYWPTFNVADIGICAGVGLMAIDMLTAKREQAKQRRGRRRRPKRAGGEDAGARTAPAASTGTSQ